MNHGDESWWRPQWEKALEQTGMTSEQLNELQRKAGKVGTHVIVKIVDRGGDVIAELNAAVERREERLQKRIEDFVAETCRGVLQRGPLAMFRVPSEQRRKLVHARLLARLEACDRTSPGLIIMGPTGIGKTAGCVVLVERIVREWTLVLVERWRVMYPDCDWLGAEAEAPIAWCRAYDIGTARQQSALGGEAPLVKLAKSEEIIVLDDLGMERAADADVMFEVLNDRYDRGAATYITTGLEEHELVARYGAPRIRRIIESGGTRAGTVNLFPPPQQLRSVR